MKHEEVSRYVKDGDGSRIVTAKNSYFYLVTVAAAQCSAKRICEHTEKARHAEGQEAKANNCESYNTSIRGCAESAPRIFTQVLFYEAASGNGSRGKQVAR